MDEPGSGRRAKDTEVVSMTVIEEFISRVDQLEARYSTDRPLSALTDSYLLSRRLCVELRDELLAPSLFKGKDD